MKDRNIVYLSHIFDAVEQIESYLQDIEFEVFKNNQMMIDAVVRELEIVGEAAARVSDDIKKRYKKIPWAKMTAMRNNLIHEYFGIDLRIIWDTCQKDLSEVKELIGKIIG